MKYLRKNKPILICLGGGIDQIPLIKTINKSKFKLIVVDKNKNCPGKKKSDYFINSSTYNYKGIIKEIEKLKIKINLIKGIISRSSGQPIITMAKLQNKFNLNGSDPKMIQKIINKNFFSELCKKKNILVPEKYNINSLNKRNFQLLLPLVIKPSVSLYGKKGISIVEKKENFKRAIISAQKNSINKKVLIQKKIEGKDLVLLGAVKAKKFFELTTVDEINLVRNGKIKRDKYHNPSKIVNLNLKTQLIRIANKIIKIFKLNNCPLNLSFRIDCKNNIYLIEINLEISGELIHERLLVFKRGKFNTFDWYLKLFYANINIAYSNKFKEKTIKINDKILRAGNAH